MNENIQLEMNPSVKKQRSIGTSIALFSQDIDNYSFDITFTDLELQAGDQVEVLAKLQGGKLEHKSSANLVEVDGELIARYVFDTKLIDSEGHVFCYVYLKRGEKSADVGAFYFEVDLSELDKVGGKIAEVYDGRYEDLVAGFEIRLQEYRDSLPQASELRAEIDVVLSQFGMDSQAKLNQYDADAQQAIVENQTAFNLAESNRQSTYEQAENSRNLASEQAVSDFVQTANLQKNAKLGEIQADADDAINQFKQDGANEIADWREYADVELEDYLADRVVLNNLVINGDFSNGVTDWKCFYGNLTAINNELEVTVTSLQSSASYIGVNGGIPIIAGRKYYVSMLIKPKHIKATRFQIGNANSSVYSPPIDVYTRVSDVVTSLVTIHSVTGVRFIHQTDTLYSIGDKINFKNLMLIDITSIFGAGNEPTKLEMGELMNVIPNGWWNGELSLTQKQFITWQLNLIRKNTNAIIALGGTIV